MARPRRSPYTIHPSSHAFSLASFVGSHLIVASTPRKKSGGGGQRKAEHCPKRSDNLLIDMRQRSIWPRASSLGNENKKEDSMVRKLSLICAVAAALSPEYRSAQKLLTGGTCSRAFRFGWASKGGGLLPTLSPRRSKLPCRLDRLPNKGKPCSGF
jgi:hypothetical protein